MLIKSYSKINLSLRVQKKQKNGLHKIQSNTVLINLCDTIDIKKIKAKEDKIIFEGNFSKNINKKINSVVDTLKIVKKIKKINNKFKITVKKNIPIFAGLGGGTSNAVHIIKYFFGNNLNSKNVNIFKKKIGSDLVLFLHKQSYQKNLNKVVKYKKFHKLYFLLLYPKIYCSTKEIYSKVKQYKVHRKIDYPRIQNKKIFIDSLKKEANDLQNIVEKKHPIIKKIIKNISNLKGCEIARITGSGSVCFGVFKNKKLAIKALKEIKIKHPKYWSAVTKTI